MSKLAQPAAFFASLRASGMLGATLEPSEVQGLNALLDAMGAAGWGLGWTAYGLATAYHETAHTMQPVKEANWLSSTAQAAYFFRMYDKDGLRPAKAAELGNTQPGDGARFPGMGYPQMTGRRNYARADAELGMNGELLRNPSLAMRPDIAAKIMVLGMAEGWFTGRSLSTYLPATGSGTLDSFTSARRIINGTDRAEMIAGFAIGFQKALVAGQWQ